MWKVLKIVMVIALLVLIGIQFVPVERDNPPVEADLQAPEKVKAILRRACYDCHSHETEWPWYSYVAPISWLIEEDVKEGREEMNFSWWGTMDPESAADMREEIWEEIEKGKMPLPDYLRMHSEAELSDEDRRVLREWAKQ